MFHLWYERQMDRELNIRTRIMREWTEIEDLMLYNRLESTPYQALDKLFEFNELGRILVLLILVVAAVVLLFMYIIVSIFLLPALNSI